MLLVVFYNSPEDSLKGTAVVPSDHSGECWRQGKTREEKINQGTKTMLAVVGGKLSLVFWKVDQEERNLAQTQHLLLEVQVTCEI